MWLGLVAARLHHGTHHAPVGARLRRRAPIGPLIGPRLRRRALICGWGWWQPACTTGHITPRSGPDCGVGPRLHRRAPNCTKLAWPSFAGYTKPALSYSMWLRLVGARLHHGTHRAPVGARLRRRAPLGPRLHRRAPIGPRLHRRAPIGPRLRRRAPIGPRLRRRVPIRARLRCHS